MMRYTTILGLALSVFLFAAHARTADNDDDRKTWAKWQEIGALTNCDNDAINASVICGGTTGVRVEGYNTLVFEIYYDHSAGNGYEFYFETCYEGQATTDCTDAGDWFRVSTEHASPGLVQLDQAKVFVGGATAPVSADHRQTWSISGGYLRIRLNAMVATGSPTSSDKILVNLRALYLQAH
jgi:hypothetical protein